MSDAVSIIREALARAEKDARKGVDTHSPTCHLWHPECARVRVNALVKSLEQLEARGASHLDGDMRCAHCREWWDSAGLPRHKDGCPFAVLDKWQLRGGWKEEGGT